MKESNQMKMDYKEFKSEMVMNLIQFMPEKYCNCKVVIKTEVVEQEKSLI